MGVAPVFTIRKGGPWPLVRIRDFRVAHTAYALTLSVLILPNAPDITYTLGVCHMGDISERGFHHWDIVGIPPRALHAAEWRRCV